jgi:hypothetical protein
MVDTIQEYPMNQNLLITEDWSNPDSQALYRANWPTEPDVAKLYDSGFQCGGCAFYAPFNEDFGLCCHRRSRHHRETVFEHFTCALHIEDGWQTHSFSERSPLSHDLLAADRADPEVEPEDSA